MDGPPPPERWHASEPYLRGIELFNQHKFWESHEAWEEIWRASERDAVTGSLDPLGEFAVR